MPPVTVIERVLAELRSGEKKFPGWPDDAVHGAAVVAEEAGELVKAALDWNYDRVRSCSEMKREATQTAATALRFLLWLDGHPYPNDEKRRSLPGK